MEFMSIELEYDGWGTGYTLREGEDFTTPDPTKIVPARFGDPPPLYAQLGFSMPLPFPPYTTDFVNIDNNGWIGLLGGSFTTTDWTDSVSQFLSEPPRLAVFWANWGNYDNDGGLYYETGEDEDGEYALVTWHNVREPIRSGGGKRGSTSFNGRSSFQAKLRANGNIVLTWFLVDIGGGIVGLSAGIIPTDISALV